MPKYNHIENIPAKVFFDILRSKDYQQLRPKPREKNLDRVFLSIYDDFFIQSENDQANEYLKLQNTIIAKEYNIDLLKQTLAFYYFNTTTEKMRQDFIKALKEGYDIDIDPTVPFIDEVKRILDFEIGYLENDIVLAKMEMEKMKSGSETGDFNYYDQVVAMASYLPGNMMINDNMTLAVFVAADKNIRKLNLKKK